MQKALNFLPKISSWLYLYKPRQWQSSSWCIKFSKCTAPFHITYELGQIMEIPLRMHPGTICIEKFHTKSISILSFLMFQKCRFSENYPYTRRWISPTSGGVKMFRCMPPRSHISLVRDRDGPQNTPFSIWGSPDSSCSMKGTLSNP